MSRLPRSIPLFLALSLFAALGIIPWHEAASVRWAGAIVGGTLLLWISEAAPLGVIALGVPFAAMLTGVLTWQEALGAWGDPTVFLFLGTFLLARALDKHGVFDFIASSPRLAVSKGDKGMRLTLLVMLFSGAISTVQNNTAVTAMLLPAVATLAKRLPGPALPLLALAYGSTFGGIATPVGTAPNFIGFSEMKRLDTGASFVSWLKVGIPAWLGTTALAWGVMSIAAKIVRPAAQRRSDAEAEHAGGDWFLRPEIVDVGPSLERRSDAELLARANVGVNPVDDRVVGPAGAERLPVANRAETDAERAGRAGARWAIGAFVATAVLWLGSGAVLGTTEKSSPANQFVARYVPEQLPPIVLAWLLFFVRPGGEARPVLDRHDFQALDWDTLFLIAGGICLGSVLRTSGASSELARMVAGTELPPIVALLLIAAVTVLLSELTSNTATASLMVPIAASMAEAMGISASQAICLVALSASLGFALPVSTPPNALVYGTRMVPLRQMIGVGLCVDAASTVWIVLCVYWLA